MKNVDANEVVMSLLEIQKELTKVDKQVTRRNHVISQIQTYVRAAKENNISEKLALFYISREIEAMGNPE